MGERLEKLKAMLKKEQERRIKLNNRIAILELAHSGGIGGRSCRYGAHRQCDPGTACDPAAAGGNYAPDPGCAVRSRRRV